MRPLIFFIVLALHLAILALLLNLGTRIAGNAGQPIELLYLAPVKRPRVQIENSRPQPVSTDITVAGAPPLFSSTSRSAGLASAPEGRGPAVNWIAEAHRAVRAFEIRRNQTQNSALSVSSSLDDAGALEHHAGDRSKTDNGDWIVWINAECYQIASWHSGAAAVEAVAPRTICRKSKSADQKE